MAIARKIDIVEWTLDQCLDALGIFLGMASRAALRGWGEI